MEEELFDEFELSVDEVLPDGLSLCLLLFKPRKLPR